MKILEYVALDEAGTVALAKALAPLLPEQSVIALNGPLGAGKTRFVQALCSALGVDERAVVSPTFVLLQRYEGRLPIYHLDAYRLRNEDEFWDLGPEEYLAGPGITLIEWAERVPNCLPRERLEIWIDVLGRTSRRFRCLGFGRRYQGIVARLKDELAG